MGSRRVKLILINEKENKNNKIKFLKINKIQKNGQTDFIIGLDSFAEATVTSCPELIDKVD